MKIKANKKILKDIMYSSGADTVCHPRIPTPQDTHMISEDGKKFQYELGSIWLNTAGNDPSDRVFILADFCTEDNELRARWKRILGDDSSIILPQ